MGCRTNGKIIIIIILSFCYILSVLYIKLSLLYIKLSLLYIKLSYILFNLILGYKG